MKSLFVYSCTRSKLKWICRCSFEHECCSQHGPHTALDVPLAVYLSAFLQIARDLSVAVVSSGQLLQDLFSCIGLSGGLLKCGELLVGGLPWSKGKGETR